jgi:hypothetical protein
VLLALLRRHDGHFPSLGRELGVNAMAIQYYAHLHAIWPEIRVMQAEARARRQSIASNPDAA